LKVLYNINLDLEEPEEPAETEQSEETEDEPSTEEGDEENEEPANETAVTDNYNNGDELIIPVLSLDKELPPFPIPQDLPAGRYTIVLQVMSGKDILQKTEKNYVLSWQDGFFIQRNKRILTRHCRQSSAYSQRDFCIA